MLSYLSIKITYSVHLTKDQQLVINGGSLSKSVETVFKDKKEMSHSDKKAPYCYILYDSNLKFSWKQSVIDIPVNQK